MELLRCCPRYGGDSSSCLHPSHGSEGMGRARAAAAGPRGGGCGAEVTGWPEIAAVRAALGGCAQDRDTGHAGTSRCLRVPSSQPPCQAACWAFKSTQNHLILRVSPLLWEQGTQGGAAPLVSLSQGPQSVKREVASPSSTVLLHPSRPCSPGGTAPVITTAPKPLGGVSPLSVSPSQAKDRSLLASPRLCRPSLEPFLPLRAEGTGHGASTARTRAARGGEKHSKRTER